MKSKARHGMIFSALMKGAWTLHFKGVFFFLSSPPPKALDPFL